MSASKPLVQFKNVQKSYDGKILVVKDLNLDVETGEFLTMLGPSGSGKTTCLMMLAGFEPATYGEIYLNERPINNVPPHKRGIGMVFQNYALFPHMTVAENLAFPLDVRKMSKSEREERVKKALDMVQLGEFGNRRPAQLSGGQQQRVAVARALVFDPELVLMDEPLGALDKNLREQMQYEIKHIHENLGVTVVYVTHDQSEALTMSNRIAVFNDGVIQQLAPPDDLYERPDNAFVAQFIGGHNVVALPEGRFAIRTDAVGLSQTGAGKLQGSITAVEYQGAHVSVSARIAGDQEISALIPEDTFFNNPMNPGDQVGLIWEDANMHKLTA